MYLYTIEKLISSDNAAKDIDMLSNILSNAEQMHMVLGQLFNVSGTPSWRAQNNILYKKCQGTTATFIVQSDIPIDRTSAKQNNFKVTELQVPKINKGDHFTLTVEVSPFKTDGIKRKKLFIRDKNARLEWISNKLSDACKVESIDERGALTRHMAHVLKENNAQLLHGYTYQINVAIQDAQAFTQIMQKGVGPGKAYGFGLIEVTK